MTNEQSERLVCAFEKMSQCLESLCASTYDIANKNHLDIEIYGLRPIVEAMKEQTEVMKINNEKNANK